MLGRGARDHRAARREERQPARSSSAAADLGDDALRPDQGPPGPVQPPEQRRQVHRARARSRLSAARAPAGGRRLARVQRRRHRHRHDRRAAGASCSRPFTQADASTTRRVRRDRARARDHPALLPHARRRRRRSRASRARARPSPSAACRRPTSPSRETVAARPRPAPTGRHGARAGHRRRPARARAARAESCRREGYRVVQAAGGAEGLRLARELRPDAITLDVMMPDMDGWAVSRRSRPTPSCAAIPVVLVTDPGRPRDWATRSAPPTT